MGYHVARSVVLLTDFLKRMSGDCLHAGILRSKPMRRGFEALNDQTDGVCVWLFVLKVSAPNRWLRRPRVFVIVSTGRAYDGFCRGAARHRPS